MAKAKTGPPRRQMTWRRMDLHIHTPASADYKDRGVTWLQILQQAEAKALDIIAITDHNTVAGYAAMYQEIELLLKLERLGRLSPQERADLAEYRRLSEKIMVLPGFEVTATLGFHILGIFPSGTSVRKLEHVLLDLNIPEDKLELGSSEVGATSDVLTCYRVIAEAGGLVIAAHANSSHGVAMQGWDFGGQTRIAYTQDPNLHALEVTDLESTSRRRTANFFNGSKPEYPRRMHCIQGSDCHHLVRDPKDKAQPWGVGDRVTEILLPEVSFEAIMEVFKGDDFSRTRPARPASQAPFDFIQAARKAGPSLVQAFHESLSPKPTRLLALMADICAMANTNGGTIYVGVSGSPNAAVKGIERPDEAMELVRSEVQKTVTPPIDISIDVRVTEGKKVLEIKVPKGDDTPYCLANGLIYVRQETESTPALRDEIIRLVMQNKRVTPAPSAPPPVAAPVAVQPAAEAVVDRPEPLSPLSASPSAEALAAGEHEVAVPPPRTGVEVIKSEERGGILHHTVKDLRNGNVIHNVTRFSARHLWRYAITELEDHPVDPKDVTWKGNIGLWKTYKRGGVKRYNLVQRDSHGNLHVYYGVTEDGIHGPWRQFLSGAGEVLPSTPEEGIEAEGAESITAIAPTEEAWATEQETETMPAGSEAPPPTSRSRDEVLEKQGDVEPPAKPGGLLHSLVSRIMGD